jgi:hypothetical protein
MPAWTPNRHREKGVTSPLGTQFLSAFGACEGIGQQIIDWPQASDPGPTARLIHVNAPRHETGNRAGCSGADPR